MGLPFPFPVCFNLGGAPPAAGSIGAGGVPGVGWGAQALPTDPARAAHPTYLPTYLPQKKEGKGFPPCPRLSAAGGRA